MARASISPTSSRARWTAKSRNGRRSRKRRRDAIAANGGTISHHHGVGEDHLPWMAQEKGALGIEILRAIKHTLDPKGILNPGKLIP